MTFATAGQDQNHLAHTHHGTGGLPSLGKLAAPVFWFLVVMPVLVGKAGLLEIIFPVGALAVGALLVTRDPARFAAFTWWLWFLTPEVRRLVDYQAGWSVISPVMVTPFAVGAMTCLVIAQYLPMLRYRAYFGFVPVMLGIFYAYFNGITQAGMAAATFALLNWLVPVTLGLYVALHWPLYPQIRDAVLRAFVLGLALVGGYGLIQYFFMPAWDARWLINVGMTNQGMPLPMQVRVFSTLNSSGPLAFLLVTGLAVLPAARGILVPIAGALTLGSLLLSLVRAAWLAGLFTFAWLLLTMPGRHRLRLVAVGVGLVLCSLPLLSVPLVNQAIVSRFDTLNSMENDRSYQERQEFYGRFLIQALTEVRGAGLGTIDTATKLTNEDGQLGAMAFFDSGILRVPYELGWPGTLGYVAGIIALTVGMLRRGGAPPDPFARCAETAALTILLCMVFEHTLVKVTGVGFWFFLGMAMAAKNHGLATRQVAAEQTTVEQAAARQLQEDKQWTEA
ncbi:O-antigen ligase family protein [Azospirillum palustre]|uniref:O-antigen ligase family protein n=1 Tax=Azospirillum palustre TaxID=2044885 RepID=UPI001FCEA156|nr:O-antigen ligase family protein [Azospirillum palustre]